MLRYALMFMPVLVLVGLSGCTGSEPLDDEAFLESIRSSAETAPESTIRHQYALEPGAKIPRIEFESPNVVVENVPYDGVGEKRVKIYNRGEGMLRISSVTTSCACTTGRVQSDTIPPGGETDLIVNIYPDKISGFAATRILTISSNDPNMNSFGLPVTSYIIPEFELVPESTNLGAVEAGKGYDRHYIVRQLIDDPLELEDARSSQDYVVPSFELRPQESWAHPDRREYDLTLHVKPDAPVGRIDGKLALDVNLKRVNRIAYDLVGVIHRNPYTTMPRSSVYSNVQPGAVFERSFNITSDKPIVFQSMETEGSGLSLRVRDDADPNELVLDLLVDADVAEPVISQVWSVAFEIGGKSYIEQLSGYVTMDTQLPESD